jgi:hypothetical protein
VNTLRIRFEVLRQLNATKSSRAMSRVDVVLSLLTAVLITEAQAVSEKFHTNSILILMLPEKT